MFKLKALLFIFLSSLAGLLFFSVNALAKEGDCHLEHCYVPAPTIITPQINTTVAGNLNITGLTWKTTVVKVFLDGVELKNIKQIKHLDYYGSFWAWTDVPLKPGKHFVYTIAYSEKPSDFDQSKESLYIYFNVPNIVKPIVKAEVKERVEQATNETVSENVKTLPVIPADTSTSTVNVIQPSSDNQVEVDAGQISGGVSVIGEGMPEQQDDVKTETENNIQPDLKALQPAAPAEQIKDQLSGVDGNKVLSETQQRNRTIGLLFLATILLAMVISRAINYHKRRGEIPPAPQPPENRTENFDWSVPIEEIKIDLPEERTTEEWPLPEEPAIPLNEWSQDEPDDDQRVR